MTLEEFINNPPTEIVKYPSAILREKAKPVGEVTETVRKATEIMLELMRKFGGIGLAAPQVGLPYRIFVVDHEPYFFIDPEVIHLGTRTSCEFEGCLSLPGIQIKIDRPKRFMFKAKTITGETKKYAYEGLMGRVSQHEYDHLNGILIIDKPSSK